MRTPPEEKTTVPAETSGPAAAPEHPANPEPTAVPEDTARAEEDTAHTDGAGADGGRAPDPETAAWSGPSAWVMPGLAAALGILGVWGGLTVEVPPDATRPGPGAFPGAVGVLLLITAAGMAVANLRARGTGSGTALAWFETRPTLIVLAGLVVHTALLEPLGWLFAGALLFWIVAYAFGARAYLRDAIVALSMSAAVQVGFSLGLGLGLPGGILELML
ncbi:tripartite tricarboxylate transporter TctB family protein [Nocardiopsis nanhaiensis]